MIESLMGMYKEIHVLISAEVEKEFWRDFLRELGVTYTLPQLWHLSAAQFRKIT